MAEYQIRSVTVADAQGIAENNVSAFWGEPGWRIMYEKETGGPFIGLESLIAINKIRWPHNLLMNRAARRHQVVVHVPTGEIVGYARWLLPEGYHDKWLETQVPDIDAAQREAYAEVYGRNPLPHNRTDNAVSDAHYGPWKAKYGPFVPFITFDYLATKPTHQRKGIARMLTQAGIAAAEELGLPISLYCTTKRGYPMYLSLGFEPHDQKEEDLAQYNWHGTYDTYYLTKGELGPKPE